jgi:hypothetical protein
MAAKIYAEGDDGPELENAIKSIEAWKAFELELVTIRRLFLEKIIHIAQVPVSELFLEEIIRIVQVIRILWAPVSACVPSNCGQYLCPGSSHWYGRYDALTALVITILLLLIGIFATTVHPFKAKDVPTCS